MANHQRRSSIPLPTTKPSPYRQQRNHYTPTEDDDESSATSTTTRPKSVLIPRTSLDLTSPDSTRYIKPTSSPSPHTTPNGRHRRRSTTSLPPFSVSPNGADFELLPFGSNNYTSLKDILPGGSPLSPTPNAVAPTAAAASDSSPPSSSSAAVVGNSSIACHEISIRNRLVKHAAWAYLQPMETSADTEGSRLWNYLTCDFLRPFFHNVENFVVHWSSRVTNWFADALWCLLCR